MRDPERPVPVNAGHSLPGRRAVIDIGSNSLRLVIWSDASRVPVVLLNEKVNANLGRTLGKDRRLPEKAMNAALTALARYVELLRLHGVADARVVATAAVRDADNGAAFLERVHALGLAPELLTGPEEARFSALGVLSAFPTADGIVGDLGGGSLELIDVSDGAPGRGASFPWGTLRLPELRAGTAAAFEHALRTTLEQDGWGGAAEGRTFYLVGGSWRALALVTMRETSWPLLDPHGYELTPDQAAALPSVLAVASVKRLQEVPRLSSSRIPSLPDAAALLAAVVEVLRPRRIVVSAFGLREGVMFDSLDARTRALDPLLVEVDAHCAGRGAEGGLDGALLARWIEPLFAAEPHSDDRLRLAACRLTALVHAAPGQLRAQRAIDLALHERWIGLAPAGRAMIAAALLSDAGAGVPPLELRALSAEEPLARAVRWGQAMRFARKLCGNTDVVLASSRLVVEDGSLLLTLSASIAAIYGEGAQQQHRLLAAHLGLIPALAIDAEAAAMDDVIA